MNNTTARTQNADIIRTIGQLLASQGSYLVTAESCTGGGIAQEITEVPGVSDWFYGGFVTYSNRAKTTLLGVDGEVLQSYGAVSQAVVEQMARGALAASGAKIAVSTSGIAGPGGGTPHKPVGTVWIGWAVGERCDSQHFLFDGSREQVRQATITAALTGVLARLQPTLGENQQITV